jgi:hypothetical protein
MTTIGADDGPLVLSKVLTLREFRRDERMKARARRRG